MIKSERRNEICTVGSRNEDGSPRQEGGGSSFSIEAPGLDRNVLSKFGNSSNVKRVAVFVDFSGSGPSHRMINYSPRAKVISMMREEMGNLGFSEVVLLEL